MRTYGELFREGDTVGVVLDADAGTVRFRLNGVDLGPAVEGLQGLGTLYPTFSLYNKDDALRLLPDSFTTSRAPCTGSASSAGRLQQLADAAEMMEAMSGAAPVPRALPRSILADVARTAAAWRQVSESVAALLLTCLLACWFPPSCRTDPVALVVMVLL